MTNIQEGGNIIPDLLNLGMPLGLSIIASNPFSSINNKKDGQGKAGEKDGKNGNKQSGGDIMSNNLLLEFGLSIIPFSLIAISELIGYVKPTQVDVKPTPKKGNTKP